MQKDPARTPRINSIFAAIPMLSPIAKINKKGHLHKSDLNSHLVVPTGIEPENEISFLGRE
jgi:hypothetical protein